MALDALGARIASQIGAPADAAFAASNGRVHVKGDPSKGLAWKDACKRLGTEPVMVDGANGSRVLLVAFLALLALASPASPPAERLSHAGVVRVEDGLLVDDGGPFWAVGATYMAAPWFMKFERARLERDLALLATGGVDYIRVLGEVGGEPWTGREIDPRWSDYEDIVAGLTDLAYDRYGLRVQWTVFGGTAYSLLPEDRARLVDRIVRVIAERPQKAMLIEIGNEAWKNGFGGTSGRDELRDLVRRAVTGLRERRVPLPVAPSASQSEACSDITALYAGLGAGVLVLHTSRDTSGPEGPWGPVMEPARYRACPDTPAVVAVNEPIGPGSSVTSEDDPLRLASAALVSVLSRVPLHVLHSRAGVRGDVDFASLPNIRATLDGLKALHRLLPRDLARGTRLRPEDDQVPFELRSPLGPDLRGSQGAVGHLVTQLDREFYVAAVGVRGTLSLRARVPLEVAAHDVLTGEAIRRAALAAGEVIDVAGREAWLLRARR
jgi:hypothetical protein